jgi:hypothetical protein
MALHSVRIDGNDLIQSMKGNIAATKFMLVQWWMQERLPNVIVLVIQELTQNVYSHNAQTAVRLNGKDSKHCFIKDRVADIFGRIRICRDLGHTGKARIDMSYQCTYLSQDIVHKITSMSVLLAEQAQESEDLYLEERICDSRYVMLGTVSSGNKRFQVPNKEWNSLLFMRNDFATKGRQGQTLRKS